jgi:hypothetical protein
MVAILSNPVVNFGHRQTTRKGRRSSTNHGQCAASLPENDCAVHVDSTISFIYEEMPAGLQKMMF